MATQTTDQHPGTGESSMIINELRKIQQAAKVLEDTSKALVITTLAEIAIQLHKMNQGNGLDSEE